MDCFVGPSWGVGRRLVTLRRLQGVRLQVGNGQMVEHVVSLRAEEYWRSGLAATCIFSRYLTDFCFPRRPGIGLCVTRPARGGVCTILAPPSGLSIKHIPDPDHPICRP